MFRRFKPTKTDVRSIDGMRRREMDGDLLDASLLPWDETTNETVATDTTSAEVQRQQIIRYFLEGCTPACLSDTKWRATAEQAKEFRKKISKGEIAETDETELLLAVRDPLNNPKIGSRRIFESIMTDPRQRQILAVMAGYTESNWQELDETALEKFLTKRENGKADYRTPVGFEKAKRRFLERIRPRASEAVLEAYARSMESLEKVLYGRRLDYYKQFERLKQEASMSEQELADAQVIKPEVNQLTAEKAESILARAVIEGDAWQQNGKDYQLSTHHLMQAGLEPAFSVKFEGKEFYFSTPFKLASGKLAILGYMLGKHDVMKVRSYYRAQPQGLWRYVPDYVRDVNKVSGIACFGQGYNEVSLSLPAGLQMVLAEIESRVGCKQITVTNPNFFLVGTAKAYNSLQDYREMLISNYKTGDYYTEVASEPFNHEFQATDGYHVAPQTLAISYEKMPDFTHKSAEFTTHVSLVGEVKAEAFRSHDGQLEWLFFRDNLGRAWIGQVEPLAKLTTLGLRQEWLLMGDFTTPLYDFSRYSGGYGDASDVKGPRQCMWRNYLSKIPLIQEYIRHLM